MDVLLRCLSWMAMEVEEIGGSVTLTVLLSFSQAVEARGKSKAQQRPLLMLVQAGAVIGAAVFPLSCLTWLPRWRQ
jgi:MFS-type transporter involved in bile tolerance (Atg22 family)